MGFCLLDADWLPPAAMVIMAVNVSASARLRSSPAHQGLSFWTRSVPVTVRLQHIFFLLACECVCACVCACVRAATCVSKVDGQTDKQT